MQWIAFARRWLGHCVIEHAGEDRPFRLRRVSLLLLSAGEEPGGPVAGAALRSFAVVVVVGVGLVLVAPSDCTQDSASGSLESWRGGLRRAAGR